MIVTERSATEGQPGRPRHIDIYTSEPACSHHGCNVKLVPVALERAERAHSAARRRPDVELSKPGRRTSNWSGLQRGVGDEVMPTVFGLAYLTKVVTATLRGWARPVNPSAS